jgi:hypothetical protein
VSQATRSEHIQAEAAVCCAQCRSNAQSNIAGGNIQGALRCIMFCRSGHRVVSEAGEIVALPTPPDETSVAIRVESDVTFQPDPTFKTSCVTVSVGIDATQTVGVRLGPCGSGVSPTIGEALRMLEGVLLAAAADVRNQCLIAERSTRQEPEPEAKG